MPKKPEAALPTLLLELMEKWEEFSYKVQKSPSAKELGEYEKGFVAGFEAAHMELRTMIAQVQGIQLPKTKPLDVPITDISAQGVDATPVPQQIWEYLYVKFEQTSEGVWRLQEVNGVEQLDWHKAPSFDDAIQRLREEEGWRLTTFSKGLHVFRRTPSTD